MSTSQDQCPVCGSPNTECREGPETRDGNLYVCSNCGKFFTTRRALSALANLSSMEKAVLSHQIWLNQTNDSAEPYRVSFTQLESLKDRRLPDPAEQLDLLIRYFGQKQKGSPGSLVKENFLNLRAKIGALNGDDVVVIFQYALKEDLIEGDDGPSCTGKLTLKGWQRFREIRRGAVARDGVAVDAGDGPESVGLPRPTEESSEMFDVFLAHKSSDKSAVLAISEVLKKAGIRPWIDVEQIPPGRSFQKVIQAAISEVKSAAVFIGPDGVGRWQDQEVILLQGQCVERNIPLIPVLLPGVDDISEELMLLRQYNWVKFEALDDPKAFERLVWGITQKKP